MSGRRQYTNLESLPIEKYYLWRDLASEPYKKDFLDFKGGVYYYGPKEIDRFLAPEWREHHERLNARLAVSRRNYRRNIRFFIPFAKARSRLTSRCMSEETRRILAKLLRGDT